MNEFSLKFFGPLPLALIKQSKRWNTLSNMLCHFKPVHFLLMKKEWHENCPRQSTFIGVICGNLF
jgi:hypothetical protein